MQVLPQLKMLTTCRSADFLFVLIKVLAESLYLVGLKRHADYSNEGHIATMGNNGFAKQSKKTDFCYKQQKPCKKQGFQIIVLCISRCYS